MSKTRINPKTLALAADNVDTLRAVKTGAAEGLTALATVLGRDKSNLNRTLKALREFGLIGEGVKQLTELGAAALDALDRAEAGGDEPGSPAGTDAATDVVMLPHVQIIPDADQARQDWDSADARAELSDLAADVVERGVLQNLLVRAPHDGVDADAVIAHRAAHNLAPDMPVYVLDGGERRWRAVGLAIADGRWPADRRLPCRIIETDALGHQLVGLAENLQRRALNPIEKARAFEALATAAGMSNAEIAARVKSTPEHVQQHRRFLKLPARDQARMVLPKDDDQHLSVRGARSLLAELAAKEEKQAALLALPIELRLAAAELVHAVTSRATYSWADIVVQPGAADTAIGKALLEKDWARFSDGPRNYGTTLGHYTVSRGYGLPHDLAPWASSSDAAERDRGLCKLQAEAGHPDVEGYVTSWLNGPFELDAAGQALVEANAKRRAEQEAAEKQRTETDRQQAEQVKAARAAATQLADEARLAPPAANLTGLPAVCESLAHPLPWSVNERAEILDARGRKVLRIGEFYGAVTDRHHAVALIVALATNVAAGETLAAPPAAPDEAGFVGWMAGRLQLCLTDATPESAIDQAKAILAEFLDDNGIDFGDDDFAWDEAGAAELVNDFLENCEAAAPAEEAA